VINAMPSALANMKVPQPFTKVTLQMSQNKVPTILFVLPLYHKMEQHLEAVSTDPGVTFKVQHAVDKGLDKLRKYSIPAKLHHSYIIRTSTFLHLIDFISHINSSMLIVLHPCLRSHWFASTAKSNDEDVQKQAIETAEVIFWYITECYLETLTPLPAPVVLPKAAAKPVVKTPSFLASACAFQHTITAMSSMI